MLKKKMLGLLLVCALLITPMAGVRAAEQTVALPERGNAQNLAAADTLVLNGASRDDDVITLPCGTTAAVASTDAVKAADGKNYVLTFLTSTVVTDKELALTATFAQTGTQSQSIKISDDGVSYIDAAGTAHALTDSATGGHAATFSVFVQPDGDTCSIYIYMNGSLKGEFHKQQDLEPTLCLTGPVGVAGAWNPVIRELVMYTTADLYGDVDGDGDVDTTDSLRLGRYLANWDGYGEDTIHADNADLDQNGDVNSEDHMALQRKLANWRGYDGTGTPYIPTIVVTDRGVDNTGKTDVTDLLTELHARGERIYYPNGTYLFNGDTLDFSGGVVFQSKDRVTIRNSISDVNIVNFDDNGNLIGLMQNHLEDKCARKNDTSFVKTGSLVSPPISTANFDTKVDFLPYWYNDFGLHYRYTSNEGNVKWYDWKWNHHDVGTVCKSCGGNVPIDEDPYAEHTCSVCGTVLEGEDQYDAASHPLLGWYFGDDATVLDWQCYWLQEYGIQQSILITSALDLNNWQDKSSATHWVYQLLNNAPNAQQMDFSLWVESKSYSTNEAAIKTSWWNTFNEFYFNDDYKDMVYCYEQDGKRYPVVFVWSEDSVKYSLSNNTSNLTKLYKEVAQAFKDNGYDGVCILARQPKLNASYRATLASSGVLWSACEYAPRDNTSGSTYAERVNSVNMSLGVEWVYGVATSVHSNAAHTSTWVCPGSNATDFGRWIAKAVSATTANSSRTQIVTCYNIAEWAEGGQSLQPSVANGFSYLEAVRDNIVK